MSSIPSQIYYIIQISMGSISLCASFLMILSIFFSTDALGILYRRIIFSISISDLLLSLGLVTGPFAPPPDTPSALWATGNIQTCEANGFIMVLGQLGVYFYTAMLGIYYYCKLNKKMNDATFTKIEKVLHIFMTLFMLAIVFTTLIMNSFNPAPPRGSFCYVTAFPYGCRQNPEKVGECKRGGDVTTVPLVLVFICQQFVCLIIVIITMILVGRNAINIQRRFRSTEHIPQVKQSFFTTLCNFLRCIPCQFHDQQEYETDADVVLRHYTRETLIQAFLYCGAFLFTFSITFITTMLYTFGNTSLQGAYDTFGILRKILFPLGGLFNILIYTRPNVKRLRDFHPDLSWLTAFLLVLKAGNELPILTSEYTGCRKLLCCKNSWNTINNRRGRQIAYESDDDNNIRGNQIANTGDDEHQGSTEITSVWNYTTELDSDKYHNSDL